MKKEIKILIAILIIAIFVWEYYTMPEYKMCEAIIKNYGK